MKFEKKEERFYSCDMHPKDTDRMTNNEDPDKTWSALFAQAYQSDTMK